MSSLASLRGVEENRAASFRALGRTKSWIIPMPGWPWRLPKTVYKSPLRFINRPMDFIVFVDFSSLEVSTDVGVKLSSRWGGFFDDREGKCVTRGMD